MYPKFLPGPIVPLQRYIPQILIFREFSGEMPQMNLYKHTVSLQLHMALQQPHFSPPGAWNNWQYKNSKTLASATTLSDFYVDDLLTGSDSVAEARQLQRELITMLNSGEFNLRKWCSNEAQLLEVVQNQDKQKEYRVHPVEFGTIKTLGVWWNPEKDSFSVKPSNQQHRISKRLMISQITSLFDPLRLLGPVIVRAKVLLQCIWEQKIEWYEILPESCLLYTSRCV